MLATIRVILDKTIVNVALAHMMGTLSAAADRNTWVLTAYILMSAIFIPLTGFLAKRLGRRKLLLISIGSFVVASALCGQANMLGFIDAFWFIMWTLILLAPLLLLLRRGSAD